MPSATSLPSTPTWAGTHRMRTSLPRPTSPAASSMIALAHCWQGPSASDNALLMAGWQSENTVYFLPDWSLSSKMLSAWYIAQTSASKTSLLVPRWKRLPVHPSSVCHTHAAPTAPLSSLEPSVQIVPALLQFCAVSFAGAFSSMVKPPGKVLPSSHLWGSTDSPALVPAAALSLWTTAPSSRSRISSGPPRCGGVGPLLRPRECTTTPDPPGEYDEARGSRPQDVGVSSLKPHSQRPTKGARRRRTTSHLSTSPPKFTKQLRRAGKARSEGLPR